MTIRFQHLLYRLHRLLPGVLPRGSHETGRMTFHDRPWTDADPNTLAEAARIVAPYIADAYGKSSRSTAAGLAKALEVLTSLETADRDK
jgi:hypothetical protein